MALRSKEMNKSNLFSKVPHQVMLPNVPNEWIRTLFHNLFTKTKLILELFELIGNIFLVSTFLCFSKPYILESLKYVYCIKLE